MISPATMPCWPVLLAAGCLLTGCSKPDLWHRVALQGNVTVTDIGNPDDVNGTLTIVPAAGNKGPAAVTPIKSGKYQFTKTTGPVTGSCDAIVNLYEPLPMEAGAKPSAKPVHTKPLPGAPGVKIQSMFMPERKMSIEVPDGQIPQLDLEL
jgi:hypothetical protein